MKKQYRSIVVFKEDWEDYAPSQKVNTYFYSKDGSFYHKTKESAEAQTEKAVEHLAKINLIDKVDYFKTLVREVGEWRNC